ncbi:uncharacterized protein CEXT_762951 [Caerostris extrusa]|uniref:Uncharacterized protein n=1 Tax=Caerostris extrusa TaxID=172846 RepID=A0AAV4PLW3_CAEEX|nr:uncharacterized protein CEXT_762951 [Caerostris extrusa]
MSAVEFKEVDHTDAVIDDKWEAMRKRVAVREGGHAAGPEAADQDEEGEGGLPGDPEQSSASLSIRLDLRAPACEKSYLKHELADLVDRLQAIDPKFRFDPECVPSTLSTSRDVLLTHKQMDDLMVLFDKYSVYRSVNQREAADAFKAYLKMR